MATDGMQTIHGPYTPARQLTHNEITQTQNFLGQSFGQSFFPWKKNEDGTYFRNEEEALRMLFGDPPRQTSGAPARREYYNLAEIYVGGSKAMSDIIINVVTTQDAWWLTEALPWRKWEQGMEISWDAWRFNDHSLDRTPDEGVPRTLTSQKSSFTVKMCRWAKGLRLNYEFWKTAQGLTNYAMYFRQLQNAVIETFCLMAAKKILTAKPPKDVYNPKPHNAPLTVSQFEEQIRYETRMWGIVQKKQDGVVAAHSELRRIMDERGVPAPDATIIPRGMRYCVAFRPENTKWAVSGIPGSGPRDVIATLPAFGEIVESRKFAVGDGPGADDPFYQHQTIGEYFVSSPLHLKNVEAKYYRSKWRDIDIFDMQNDKFATVSLEKCMRNCGLFIFTSGDGGGDDDDFDINVDEDKRYGMAEKDEMGAGPSSNDRRYNEFVAECCKNGEISVGHVKLSPLGKQYFDSHHYRSWLDFMRSSQMLTDFENAVTEKNIDEVLLCLGCKKDDGTEPHIGNPDQGRRGGGGGGGGGARGAMGPPGPAGAQGIRGRRGPTGKDGKDGNDGKKGDRGPRGRDGKKGDRGPPGRDGKDGNSGDRGPPGGDDGDDAENDDGPEDENDDDAEDDDDSGSGSGNPAPAAAAAAAAAVVNKYAFVGPLEADEQFLSNRIYKIAITASQDPNEAKSFAESLMPLYEWFHESILPENAASMRERLDLLRSKDALYRSHIKEGMTATEIRKATADDPAPTIFPVVDCKLRKPSRGSSKWFASLEDCFKTMRAADRRMFDFDALLPDTDWKAIKDELINHERLHEASTLLFALNRLKLSQDITAAPANADDLTSAANNALNEAFTMWFNLWDEVSQPAVGLTSGLKPAPMGTSVHFKVFPRDRQVFDRFVESADGRWIQRFLSYPQYRDLIDLVRAMLVHWKSLENFKFKLQWSVMVAAALRDIAAHPPPEVTEANLPVDKMFREFCQFSVDTSTVFGWSYDNTFEDSDDDMDVLKMCHLLTRDGASKLKALQLRLTQTQARVNNRVNVARNAVFANGVKDRTLGEKKGLLRKYMAARRITNGTLFYLCILRNLPFPLSFLLLRHMETYSMGTMVTMVKGSRTGNTIVGHACFTFGNDFVQRMHGGHFSMWAQAVIFHPENIAQLPNVFCNNYVSGEGVQFWRYTDESRNVYNGQGGEGPQCIYDIHCVAVPAYWEPQGSFIDITGNYDTRVCNDPSSRLGQEFHYPTAPLYRNYWEWRHINPDVKNEPTTPPHPRYNTICCRGTVRGYVYSGNGQFHKKTIIKGQGHWGPNVYEGCKEARIGQAGAFLREVKDEFLEPVPFLP